MKRYRLLIVALTLPLAACQSSSTGSGGQPSQAGSSGTGSGVGGRSGVGGTLSSGGASSAGGQTSSGGQTTSQNSSAQGGRGGSAGSGGTDGKGGSGASSTTLGGSTSQAGSGGAVGPEAGNRAGAGGSSKGGSTGSAGQTGSGGSDAGVDARAGGSLADGGSLVVDGSLEAGKRGVDGPCDILAAGNTPCVAAHSTVRLLASTYTGPLYQLRRVSDNKMQDIEFLPESGAADSSAQIAFCTSKCTISIIYDQSGKKNDLKRSPGGAEVCKHQDQEAVADALPITLNGLKVFGIKVVSDDNGGCTPPAGAEGTGYRLDKTSGIAVGDEAETEYMVVGGDKDTWNSGCCFDYGNVETSDKDDGAATMEALYFGNGAGWGRGGGNGPWIMADLENGIFSGSTTSYTGNTSVPYPYVTGAIIGRSGGTYAILAGNAQSGELTTMYDGARPNGYTKQKKQGAIVLGTGGDNSDHGRGYFFEGVMTTGAATAAVMNQVQANILAAGYGK